MAKNNNNQATESKFNVTFGVKNVDKIPANAAVLLNECRKRVDGEFKTVVEFMAISGVKSTKTTDLVLPVLTVMLCDARTRGGFANDFKVVIVASQEITTKLTAKSCFTKWLKGNCIYKSNSQGELNKALVLDEGLHLRNTALRVSEKQPLYAAKGEVQRVLLFKTAEAIVKQSSMFSGIIKEARSVFNAAYAESKPVSKPVAKTAVAAVA